MAALGCGSPPVLPAGDAGASQQDASQPVDTPSAPPDSGTATPEPDAGVPTDAGPPADAGTRADLHWTPAFTAFNPGLDHHGTVVTQSAGTAALHILGGYNNDLFGLTKAVLSAKLGDDGKPAPFARGADLPGARSGHGVVAVGGRIYVTCGRDVMLANLSDTLIGQTNEQGAVTAWTQGPALTGARWHHASATDGTHLYVIGGTTELPVALGDVQMSTVQPDGALSPWTAVTSLPAGRTHHAAVVHAGALYVLGGLSGEDPAPELLRAPIQDDGTLGAWEKLGTLGNSPATHSAFIYDDRVYLVGGSTGGNHHAAPADTVRSAPFLPDGKLGDWRMGTPLPRARSHVHHTPIFRSFVYSFGGRDGAGHTLNMLDIGELAKP